MAVIYYLNWDEEEREHGPASELFHRLTVKEVLEEDEKPGDRHSQSEFDQLYRELIDVHIEDPEDAFKQWNRGSRQESQEFLELRYCDRCDSYIQGSNEALIHAVENHGYNQIGEEEVSEPGYIRGVRSLSVGDVVEIDGTFYRCENLGWQEIEVGDSSE